MGKGASGVHHFVGRRGGRLAVSQTENLSNHEWTRGYEVEAVHLL
jgi:hypothetical protein